MILALIRDWNVQQVQICPQHCASSKMSWRRSICCDRSERWPQRRIPSIASLSLIALWCPHGDIAFITRHGQKSPAYSLAVGEKERPEFLRALANVWGLAHLCKFQFPHLKNEDDNIYFASALVRIRRDNIWKPFIPSSTAGIAPNERTATQILGSEFIPT